jgi:hypothetical protein
MSDLVAATHCRVRMRLPAKGGAVAAQDETPLNDESNRQEARRQALRIRARTPSRSEEIRGGTHPEPVSGTACMDGELRLRPVRDLPAI